MDGKGHLEESFLGAQCPNGTEVLQRQSIASRLENGGPEKRGQAFALFGVAVVVAPVVGPTLGGWLSDNVSWHWCFLINGPVGLLAMALIALILRESAAAVAERRRLQQQGGGFDLVGFMLVATFLGALEITLDRGLQDDWFGSTFIVTAAATMEEAVWLALKLNQACHIQLMAEWAGGPKFVGDPEQAKIKGAYASRPDIHVAAFNYVLRRSKR